MRRAGRRGFTLVELLISMTILAIVGTAATKMLITQQRFAQFVYTKRSARAVGRASVNLLASELQMVQDTLGVDSLDTGGKAIRVRVPYRFGLICGYTNKLVTATLLPVDSAILAQAVQKGYGYRTVTNGRYTIIPSTTAPVAAATPATCTGTSAGDQNIQSFGMNSRTSAVVDIAPGDSLHMTSASLRQPIYYFQEVMYYFAASNAFPGYNGLFRKVTGGNTDELMAPFDTSARFRFYKLGDDTSRTTITLADTNTIVGVDVVLPGRSSLSIQTYTSPKISLQTAIFFKNRRNF